MQGPDLAYDPEQLEYPACTLETALYSPQDSMQGPNLACDPEQLEYMFRPMTPG